MRSLTRSRCGLVYEPVERPTASSSAAIMRVADVLPFVPVRCTAGNSSCGRARAARSAPRSGRASARSCAGRPRRDADAGLEVHVRVEPRRALGQVHGSGAGSSASSTSTVNASPASVSSARDRAGAADVGRDAASSAASRSGVSVTHDACDLGAHRPLRLGLRLADRAEHLGRDRVVERGLVAGERARRRRRCGQRCRCTEPSCHHDQTSSVTKQRNGANRRSSVDSASASAARAEPAAALADRCRTRAASPARGSRRRSPRRTARCARARGRSRSRRTRR